MSLNSFLHPSRRTTIALTSPLHLIANTNLRTPAITNHHNQATTSRWVECYRGPLLPLPFRRLGLSWIKSVPKTANNPGRTPFAPVPTAGATTAVAPIAARERRGSPLPLFFCIPPSVRRLKSPDPPQSPAASCLSRPGPGSFTSPGYRKTSTAGSPGTEIPSFITSISDMKRCIFEAIFHRHSLELGSDIGRARPRPFEM